MVGELVEKNLYDAASEGDVTTFHQLLQQDPYLLDRVSFGCSNRTPLHTATLKGKLPFVEEVLQRNPQLARELDSQKSSPLHIAAAQGHDQIASILFTAAPEMRWWRDCQGMNPVHIAAMNGYVVILTRLLMFDSSPAMERVHRGQTVLHLCVKHHQFGALVVLVRKLGDLVYAKDDDGDTILHLAVRCNQLEIIRYLVEGEGDTNKIKKETQNSMGKTALDIFHETPSSLNPLDYSEMERMLMILSKQRMLKALPKLTDTTMVVVVLIATMAFQAAVNPPGGVWQGDTSPHRAGDAVMASTHPKIYKHFVCANTTAFISSLITIFLITTRQPSGRFHFLFIAVLAMWVSLASIAVSYGASVMVITPNTETQSLVPIIIAVVVVSLSIMGLIIVYSSIRRLYLSWKSKMWRHEDLTNDALIKRVFYWIFQIFKMRKDFKLTAALALVVRVSERSTAAMTPT